MSGKKSGTREGGFALASVRRFLAGSLALVVASIMPKAGSVPDDPLGKEEVAWQRVRAMESAEAFQEFIREFPESPRVADAFEMLVVLELGAADLPGDADGDYSVLAQADFSEELRPGEFPY